MKGAVMYKGCWLTRGSRALELHEAKEIKKLDQHMKQLDADMKARGDVPHWRGRPETEANPQF